VRVFAVVLLLSAVCRADEVGDAADKVLAAFRAKQDLKPWASKSKPRPWSVADRLCSRMEYDAALAFAKAAPRPDTEKLPGYVESQRTNPTPVEYRKALAEQIEAIAAKQWDRARELAAIAGDDHEDLTAIRLRWGRALAYARAGRFAESLPGLLAAGADFERLGCLLCAKYCFWQAAGWGQNVGRHGVVEIASKRLAVVESRRGDKAGEARAYSFLVGSQLPLGKSKEADQAATKGLAIAAETELSPELFGDLCTAAARAARLVGRLDEAERRARRGLAIEGVAALTRPQLFQVLSRTLEQKGAFDEAERYNASAVEVWLKVRAGAPPRVGHVFEAELLIDRARLRSRRGEINEALADVRRAEGLARRARDRATLIMALRTRAALERNLGRRDAARETMKTVLAMHQKAGELDLAAARLADIAGLYPVQDKALAHRDAEAAIRLAKASGNEAARADALVVLARLALNEHKVDDALRLAAESEAIDAAKTVVRAEAAEIRGEIRDGYRIDIDKALAAYQEAYRLFSLPDGVPYNAAINALRSARIHANRGRADLARKWLAKGRRCFDLRPGSSHLAYARRMVAHIHFELAEFEQAEREIRRAMEQEANSTRLWLLSRICDQQGRAREAYNHASASLEQARLAKRRASELQALQSLAYLCGRLGKPDDGFRHAEEALRLARELKRPIDEVAALDALAALHGRRGEYARAIEHREAALRLIRAQPRSAKQEAALLANLASSYGAIGDSVRVEAVLRRAHELAVDVRDRAIAARAATNLGIFYRRQGRLGDARRLLQQALETERALGRKAREAHCLRSLAALARQLGDRAENIRLLREAVRLNDKLGSADPAALTYLALALAMEGRKQEVRALTERALPLAKNKVDVLYNAGILFLHSLAEPDRARDLLEQSAALWESRFERARGLTDEQTANVIEGVRFVFFELARAHLALGAPAAALQALERGRARLVLNLLARSRFDPLAEAERRAREQQDTVRIGKIAAVREELAQADGEVTRLTHLLEVKPTPAARKELSAARKRYSDAAFVRRRLIADLLPVGAPRSVAAIRAILREGERVLFYAYHEHLCVGLLFVIGDQVRAYALSGFTEPGQLEAAVAAFVKAGSGGGSDGRGMRDTSGKTKPGKEVDGQRLFDYLVPAAVRAELAKAKRVFLVPHGVLHRLPFEALPWDGATWLEKGPPVAYVHSGSVLGWCRQRRDAQQGRNARFEVVALGDPVFARDHKAPTLPEQGVLVVKAAGPFLVGDVLMAYDGEALGSRKDLRRARRKVSDAIEDGERKPVPVRVKVWRRGSEEEFAIKPGKLGIEVAQQAPPVAWRSMTRHHVGAPPGGYGQLDPLPGTRREVEAIGKLLGKQRVATLLGEEATTAALFRLAPQGRYLHLATHQIVDERPFGGFSRLALTTPPLATPADDGFLTLNELFEGWRDRLSACELVVLSACETTKGPLQHDEGPYAMPLGFLYAGAPAVIASLWRVDDQSTAELFADFYARLAKGTPKLQAFTEARRALKQKYPQPYHWAPFVYIGDPR